MHYDARVQCRSRATTHPDSVVASRRIMPLYAATDWFIVAPPTTKFTRESLIVDSIVIAVYELCAFKISIAADATTMLIYLRYWITKATAASMRLAVQHATATIVVLSASDTKHCG